MLQAVRAPYYIYDLETFPNCFLFCGKFEGQPPQIFEISSRANQRTELLTFLSYLENLRVSMVGYNNIHFDYPILHELLTNPYTFTAQTAYLEAQKIFNQPYGRNPNSIKPGNRIIAQIDLMKINHFDNQAKRTSLKALQFAMRSESVEDLPIEIRDLTFAEMDTLRSYNIHDVTETEKFLGKCKHLIELRQELIENGAMTGDVLNYADTKIGEQYLVNKIGRGKCFTGSKPKQTFRTQIPYRDLLLPKIYFRTEPFQQVHEWFKQQTLYIKKDKTVYPKLSTTLGGLHFEYGSGGVHASVVRKKYYETETHEIIDIDVAGMYVAVAIVNGFAPEHLGRDFSVAYKQLQSDRKKYPKGSTMNAVLKLAGNGVYGNSNNKYSCFYDPKYTFTVTTNGQLQLSQLAEVLSLIPGVELIQANTDGITAYVPRSVRAWFDMWCRNWEGETGLVLEEVRYKAMFIRDVNNYLAVKTDGKVKRKGAYWWPIETAPPPEGYEGNWNKDFSNIASIKVVDQVLRNNVKPEDVIYSLTDPFDFMLRYKTPGDSKVFIGEKECLKTVRYYVSKSGEEMTKVTPVPPELEGTFKRKNKLTDEFFYAELARTPKGQHNPLIHTGNKSMNETKKSKIESGWKVKQCNVASDFNWADVDYDYYIEQARKLII